MFAKLYGFDTAKKFNAVHTADLKNGDMVNLGDLNANLEYVFDAAVPSTGSLDDIYMVFLPPVQRNERLQLKDFVVEANEIFQAFLPEEGMVFRKAASEFASAPTVGNYVEIVNGSTQWTPSATVPLGNIYGEVLDAKPLKNDGRLETPAFTIKLVAHKSNERV